MTRGFSSLFRLLRVMACSSERTFLRPREAEFPMAWSGLNRSLLTFQGMCAQDCASNDALRSFNNRVIIGYQHELTFIRQTLASFARRPKKGRSSPASARGAGEARQENILAASSCVFRKQSTESETGSRFSERFATETPTNPTEISA